MFQTFIYHRTHTSTTARSSRKNTASHCINKC